MNKWFVQMHCKLAIIIALLALFPLSAQSALIGSWSFDGNANDSSGNANHGTINGDTSLTSDRFGNPNTAYAFDGDGDYISTPTIGFPTGSSALSYSLWINPGDNPGTDRRVLQYGANANLQNFNLYINANQYRLDYWGFTYHDFDPIIQGSWQHVALTSDGLNYAFYLNGVQTFTDEHEGQSLGIDGTFTIGSHDGNCFCFAGALDDLRVYDHTLSLGEVQALAAVPVPPAFVLLLSSLGGLVCYRRTTSSFGNAVFGLASLWRRNVFKPVFPQRWWCGTARVDNRRDR